MISKNILRGHKEAVRCAIFWDENSVVSGDQNGRIIFWDLEISRASKIYNTIHTKSILNLISYQNPKTKENFLISQSREGKIKVTKDEEFKEDEFVTSEVELQSLEHGFCRMVVENNRIIYLKEEKKVVVYNIEKRKQIGVIQQEESNPDDEKIALGMILCLSFVKSNQDEKISDIIIGHEGGSVCIYDGISFKLKKIVRKINELNPIVSLDSFKNYFVTAGASNSIIVSKILKNNEVKKQFNKVILKKEGVSDLTICKETGKIMVTAGWDHRIRIYHPIKLKPLTILKFHTGTVNSIRIKNIGKNNWLICSSSEDKRIVIWNIKFNSSKKKK